MLKLHEKSGDDTVALMADIGRRARAAARPLAIATDRRQERRALSPWPTRSSPGSRHILDANAIDMSNGEESGLSASFMDRLKLNPARIRAMADGIREIAALQAIRSATSSPPGTGRTACISSACARRSASSASSMKAARTSRRMPARSASRPAIP